MSWRMATGLSKKLRIITDCTQPEGLPGAVCQPDTAPLKFSPITPIFLNIIPVNSKPCEDQAGGTELGHRASTSACPRAELKHHSKVGCVSPAWCSSWRDTTSSLNKFLIHVCVADTILLPSFLKETSILLLRLKLSTPWSLFSLSVCGTPQCFLQGNYRSKGLIPRLLTMLDSPPICRQVKNCVQLISLEIASLVWNYRTFCI